VNRAVVFISCGQRVDVGETQVADAVAEALAAEGFEPYVATAQQTLHGLKENIFARLADAEYFLFIDFCREVLEGTPPPNRRGSLFSHQELALAAYLGIDTIVFQEEGMKSLEGLLYAIQANPRRFASRAELPTEVIREVRRREWKASQQNALFLDWDVSLVRDAQLFQPPPLMGRYFHLRVRNGHYHKTARNTLAYIERVVDVANGTAVSFESVELKWAGYQLPNATILPGRYRKLDALWVPHPHSTHPQFGPNTPQFNTFADSTEFIPRLSGPGAWEVTYTVICDTMPGAKRTFKLQLDGTLEGVRFTPIELDEGST
jgi:hypothetical protein